jgi:hypothetical protein
LFTPIFPETSSLALVYPCRLAILVAALAVTLFTFASLFLDPHDLLLKAAQEFTILLQEFVVLRTQRHFFSLQSGLLPAVLFRNDVAA